LFRERERERERERKKERVSFLVENSKGWEGE
jgi:hypothetical protein